MNSKTTIPRKLVVLARAIASTDTSLKAGTDPTVVPVNLMEALESKLMAALHALERLATIGPRLEPLAKDSVKSKARYQELFAEMYNATTFLGDSVKKAVDWSSRCHSQLSDGHMVRFQGGESDSDRRTTALRQLLVLEKKYRGKVFFGANPLRVTLILEGVVAEYKRDKKVIGRLAFDPIHLHFFPGRPPAEAFGAQVLKEGTGPDYAKIEDAQSWREGDVFVAEVSQVMDPGCKQIGLTPTNAPKSSHISQPHPHIYSSGLVCQGDGGSFVGMALNEARVFDAVEVMVQILTEPKGVKDGCAEYHNILHYPHCESGCVVCEKIVTKETRAAGTSRQVHEKCVKRRCPDTNLPTDHGDGPRSIDGVWCHPTACFQSDITGKHHRIKEAVLSTLTSRTIAKSEAGVCAISGVIGRKMISAAHCQINDDLVPWGKKHACILCLDVARDPNKEEKEYEQEEKASADTQGSTTAAPLPVGHRAQWWAAPYGIPEFWKRPSYNHFRAYWDAWYNGESNKDLAPAKAQR